MRERFRGRHQMSGLGCFEHARLALRALCGLNIKRFHVAHKASQRWWWWCWGWRLHGKPRRAGWRWRSQVVYLCIVPCASDLSLPNLKTRRMPPLTDMFKIVHGSTVHTNTYAHRGVHESPNETSTCTQCSRNTQTDKRARDTQHCYSPNLYDCWESLSRRAIMAVRPAASSCC